jgi:PAS domain S-box-containing protein
LDEIPIVMVNEAGLIRFWSKGAERAFGHPHLDAVGQTLDLIVPPQFRDAHWAGFRRAMASGKADAEGKPGPFPAMRAGGEPLTINGTLSLLRRADGLAMGAMVIFS